MFVSRAVRLAPSLKSAVPSTSTRAFWAKVPKGPEDPILGITVAFNKDTDPRKINLGVGAYRGDDGKPFVLQSVREAESRIVNRKMNKEYTAIGGSPEFNKAAAALQFGADSEVIKSKRNVTLQVLSGTGALRVGAEFLARFLPNTPVYQPDPTWANHIPIFVDAGIEKRSYRYYDAKTRGLNINGMTEDLAAAPSGSIVLLHACAHNPTGVDPNLDQWSAVSQICKEKKHFVFFDSAYQGFASGDPERDVKPIHKFIADGHNPIITQSFAKNFGLYGERIGAFHIVAANAEEADRLESQLKILIRPMYSNPPIHGARLVTEILSDVELSALWRREVKQMADRIITMREALVKNLKSLGSKHDWSHVTSQIGMFCYSGLTPEQVDTLARDYHIYMTRNGRISMAGVSSGNVGYLAESMHAVTK